MRPPGAGAPPGQWPIAVRPRRGAELCAAFCAGEGALRDPRPSQAVIVLQSRGRGLVDGGGGRCHGQAASGGEPHTRHLML